MIERITPQQFGEKLLKMKRMGQKPNLQLFHKQEIVIIRDAHRVLDVRYQRTGELFPK